MREILFRGKRKDNSEWIDGFYVSLFEKENGFYKAKHYIFDGNTKLGEERYCGHGNYEQDVKICKFEVIPETVGQYTGLIDKNGTKIFEGDIVKLSHNGKCYEVKYKSGCFVVGINWAVSHETDLEVVGNVHDNPELLGGE